MVLSQPTDDVESRGRARPLARLCLAATVCAPLASLSGEPARREKATVHGASFVLLTSPSTVSVDFTAGPEVTSPTASVARFSILPLPVVATVVDVRCVREVLVSRIGGLYGP